MTSPLEFLGMKKEGRPITMVTCYDAWSAKILATTSIDALLVGDSLAMVMHGHPTTLSATVEMMELHTAAVARGNEGKQWIVGDLPFGCTRKGVAIGMEAVERLMRAGAHSVKLEGVAGHEELIRACVQAGVPVMGHLGLTPQSVFALGGYKVQGRDEKAAAAIHHDAVRLQELGAYSLVLECVPEQLGREISEKLTIPTIGIGAGRYCNGQVLVLHDLAGLQTEMKPKFLRRFGDGATQLASAASAFERETRAGTFPSENEVYLR